PGMCAYRLDLVKDGKILASKSDQFQPDNLSAKGPSPDIEVTVKQAPPYISGKEIVFTAIARDQADAPMKASELSWKVLSAPASYSMPGWPGYQFGLAENPAEPYMEKWCRTRLDHLKAITNESGRAFLGLKVDRKKNPYPLKLAVQATNSGVSDFRSIVVYPGYRHLGLKGKLFRRQAKTYVEVDAVVIDKSGNLIEKTKFDLEIRRALADATLEAALAPDQMRMPVLASRTFVSARGPTHASFELDGLHDLIVEAILEPEADSGGNRTIIQFPRAKQDMRFANAGSLVSMAGKDVYSTGERASLWIDSPFERSCGFLILSSAGSSELIPLRLDSKLKEIKLPVIKEKQGWIRGLVKLYELKEDENETQVTGRPAIGRFICKVKNKQDLTVMIDSTTDDANPVELALRVFDSTGVPVIGAEVLTVSSYDQSGNPFYRYESTEIPDATSMGSLDYLTSIPLVKTFDLEAQVSRPFPGGMITSSHHAYPQNQLPSRELPERAIRSFGTISSIATTGEVGGAISRLQIPSKRVNHQVRALSVDRKGRTGFSDIHIRLPGDLSITCCPPEFLYRGDRLDLPINIFNDQFKPADISLSLYDSGSKLIVLEKAISAPRGQSCIILANLDDRLEILDRRSKPLELAMESGGRHWTFLCNPRIISKATHPPSKDPCCRLDLIRAAQSHLSGRQIRTSLERSARILALLATRALYKELEMKEDAKLDTAIGKDVAQLTRDASQDFQFFSWFPDGANLDNWNRLGLPPLLAAHALQEAGIYGYSIDQCMANSMFCDPIFDNLGVKEDSKAFLFFQAYRFFITSRHWHKDYPEYLEHETKVLVSIIEETLKKQSLDQCDGATLSCLAMSARRIPLEEGTKMMIEQAFVKSVRQVLSKDKSEPGELETTILPPVLNESTICSFLILGLLDEKAPANSRCSQADLAKLVQPIESASRGGRWSNPTTGGIALSALCLYLRKYPSELQSALQISKLDKEEKRIPTGFCLKRTFLPANSDSRIWKDKKGLWHCQRGSSIKMKLQVLPSTTRSFLFTQCPFAAGLSPIAPKEEITYSSIPEWDTQVSWDNYNFLAQQVLVKEDSIEAYSRSLNPI
ncbi:MAG: hypothetical protein K8F91_26845, partial [Candidatus Obscuribacterales bacterium]|nr:hypothetical protein [Candidatus Obscuribacterales bacterium]